MNDLMISQSALNQPHHSQVTPKRSPHQLEGVGSNDQSFVMFDSEYECGSNGDGINGMMKMQRRVGGTVYSSAKQQNGSGSIRNSMMSGGQSLVFQIENKVRKIEEAFESQIIEKEMEMELKECIKSKDLVFSELFMMQGIDLSASTFDQENLLEYQKILELIKSLSTTPS
jgi:hypothetical protein